MADKSSVIELCLKHKRGCVWGALLALLDFYKRQSEGWIGEVLGIVLYAFYACLIAFGWLLKRVEMGVVS